MEPYSPTSLGLLVLKHGVIDDRTVTAGGYLNFFPFLKYHQGELWNLKDNKSAHH